MHIRHDIDFAGLLFRASLQCAYYMILSAFPMSRHGVFRAVSTHFCPQMIIPFSLFYPGCSGNCVIVGKLSPLRLKLFQTYSVRLRQKTAKNSGRTYCPAAYFCRDAHNLQSIRTTPHIQNNACKCLYLLKIWVIIVAKECDHHGKHHCRLRTYRLRAERKR